MPIATNRLVRALGSAGALVLVLAPLSVSAQRAFAPFPDAPAPPPFLQSVLRDLDPQPRAVPAEFDLRVGRALNEAITALNAEQYADARAALGELRLDGLSPFERGKAELVLFLIAHAEDKLAEARQHLVSAIESGGLTEQEVVAARSDIERVDARLAKGPRA